MRYLLLAMLVLSPSLAFAHAHLKTANPSADSSVTAPTELSCDFTEALEPRFSTLELQDAAGHKVDTGAMHLDGSDAKRMILPLPKLPPGAYTAVWHATSIDTHRTEGRFGFTIRP